MPMRHPCLPLLCLLACAQLPLQAQVLTAQQDNYRTGADLHEKLLTPSNVNSNHFGKLFSRTVDGDVFAQPVYVPSLAIPAVGKRNVVFVATEHDSVYAFDLNGTKDAPLWKNSFLDPSNGITTLSEQDVRCPFISPEVGITPTPVIDLASGTISDMLRATLAESGAEHGEKAHNLPAGAIRASSYACMLAF
ncbi:MAG: hypothetical protein ABR910_05400 [Acidobacteriaceae bacterium]|jgi:hypothetical protein